MFRTSTETKKNKTPILLLVLVSVVSLISGAYYLNENNGGKIANTHLTAKKSYILKTKNTKNLENYLIKNDIEISHKLGIINAFAVELSSKQLADLTKVMPVTVSENHKVTLAANNGWGSRKWQPLAEVPTVVGANSVHNSYNFGDAVTIAFLDTGLDQLDGLSTDLYGYDKAWGTYDAINNSLHNYDDEYSGHGTHVASIANNADFDVYGRIYGVAPNAATVGIKAFDSAGQATYADVIRGIDWAVQVKDDINLRILNMSFSGPVQSHYWQDPLNQAVMAAWQAGIVVVASAGNKGPEPMTIGVPGNVPYIITVGAMTDSYTASSDSDDKLATFSAAGPTFEGFVKPEVIAPGGHVAGLMSFDSQIVQEHPEFHDGGRYFEMSGTSQAAGVVSGVVALMLTADPSLTPDQVKCRLVSSANAARTENGALAYSVFQQGAGVVNAVNAINSRAENCANHGLDIAKDIAGEEHYSGPAKSTEDGNFYVEGLGSEYVWDLSDNINESNGYVWQPDVSVDRLVWKTGVGVDRLVWKTNLQVDRLVWKTNLTVDRLVWKTNVAFDQQESIAVNNWVEQQ